MKNNLIGIWRVNHSIWQLNANIRIIWNFKESGGLFEQAGDKQEWGNWSIDENNIVYINSPFFGKNFQGQLSEKFGKLWITSENPYLSGNIMLSK